ncbi:MAG: hypothetical protein JNK82_18825 [Myxococcaceae bacterium]|nr:hypothetical protein [Myxococcaceae bacterium]
MSRSARTQWVIGVIGALATALAIGWMVTHPKPQGGPGLTTAAPPRIGALKLVSATGASPLQPGDTLTTVDSIDFEVEVSDLCFLYVVTALNGNTVVQWSPEPSEPWDKGVYAPTWSEENPQGLRFASAGDVELFLVSSPLPLKDVADWPRATLRAPGAKCPKCTVTTAKFSVVDAPLARPDAGSM